jgi:hypothetical protein
MSALTTDELRPIAAHVLRRLAIRQSRVQSQRYSLRIGTLARSVGVRKEDVQETVDRLAAEGHLDGATLRLTMTGLALAVAMRECKLREATRTGRGESAGTTLLRAMTPPPARVA